MKAHMTTATALARIDAWFTREFRGVHEGDFAHGLRSIPDGYKCGTGTATMQSAVENFNVLLRSAMEETGERKQIALLGMGDTWGWMRHWAAEHYLLPTLGEILRDPDVVTGRW